VRACVCACVLRHVGTHVHARGNIASQRPRNDISRVESCPPPTPNPALNISRFSPLHSLLLSFCLALVHCHACMCARACTCNLACSLSNKQIPSAANSMDRYFRNSSCVCNGVHVESRWVWGFFFLRESQAFGVCLSVHPLQTCMHVDAAVRLNAGKSTLAQKHLGYAPILVLVYFIKQPKNAINIPRCCKQPCMHHIWREHALSIQIHRAKLCRERSIWVTGIWWEGYFFNTCTRSPCYIPSRHPNKKTYNRCDKYTCDTDMHFPHTRRTQLCLKDAVRQMQHAVPRGKNTVSTLGRRTAFGRCTALGS